MAKKTTISRKPKTVTPKQEDVDGFLNASATVAEIGKGTKKVGRKASNVPKVSNRLSSPATLIEELDRHIENDINPNRTAWINQAIREKLDREK